MLTCFYDYRFPPEMKKAFDGADRFFPINYKTHLGSGARGGQGLGRQAFDKAHLREGNASARKRKPAAKAKKG